MEIQLVKGCRCISPTLASRQRYVFSRFLIVSMLFKDLTTTTLFHNGNRGPSELPNCNFSFHGVILSRQGLPILTLSATSISRRNRRLNRNSERIPRRFCLTAVVLPVGSASAARAAGLASVYKISIIPYGRRFPAACCRVFKL